MGFFPVCQGEGKVTVESEGQEWKTKSFAKKVVARVIGQLPCHLTLNSTLTLTNSSDFPPPA